MQPKRACVIANGKEQSIDLPCSMARFLEESGWKGTQVVVEHNGQVLTRQELGSVQLEDGDQIEVIVPVAGG